MRPCAAFLLNSRGCTHLTTGSSGGHITIMGTHMLPAAPAQPSTLKISWMRCKHQSKRSDFQGTMSCRAPLLKSHFLTCSLTTSLCLTIPGGQETLTSLLEDCLSSMHELLGLCAALTAFALSSEIHPARVALFHQCVWTTQGCPLCLMLPSAQPRYAMRHPRAVMHVCSKNNCLYMLLSHSLTGRRSLPKACAAHNCHCHVAKRAPDVNLLALGR